MAIKQIGVYNGSGWDLEDIGASASNITLSNQLVGSNNLQAVLNNFLPTNKLTANKWVVTDANGKLIGKDISVMDKINPTGTGSLSINRKANTTVGTNSVAVGNNTTASGVYSHAEGESTEASGFSSHSEGSATIASGLESHAEGESTEASERFSHAEGYCTTASGVASHTEGHETTASGDYSHAEGDSTEASGEDSHSEGCSTTASGIVSHAEGNHTTASGLGSHAEGDHTTASGVNSHAEGVFTTASGVISHAEGSTTTAGGDYSHAAGKGTIANHAAQHVFGYYNEEDSSSANSSAKGTYIEIVGNGSSDLSRSNARTLDWYGNEILAGKLTVGTAPSIDMDVATKKYVDDSVARLIALIKQL